MMKIEKPDLIEIASNKDAKSSLLDALEGAIVVEEAAKNTLTGGYYLFSDTMSSRA